MSVHRLGMKLAVYALPVGPAVCGASPAYSGYVRTPEG